MLREEGLKKKFSSYCTSIKLLEEGSKKKKDVPTILVPVVRYTGFGHGSQVLLLHK